MPIKYLTGDATYPISKGPKIIIHICNDIDKWGRGFVLAISKRWKEPEIAYHNLRLCDRRLGEIQIVKVEPDIYVTNMIAQHGIGPNKKGQPPIRYDALISCLNKVNEFALTNNASIHAPRIGSGLARGNWNIIEKIINETLPEVDVYIYDLNTHTSILK